MNTKKIPKNSGNQIGAVLVLPRAHKILALMAKKSPNLLMGKHFSYPASYSGAASSRYRCGLGVSPPQGLDGSCVGRQFKHLPDFLHSLKRLMVVAHPQ